jgi:hypothetical protein
MLQMFYLDIAKVDLVLHMLQWDSPTVAAPAAIGASPSERRWSHAGEQRGFDPTERMTSRQLGPVWAAKRRRGRVQAQVFVRALALLLLG